MARQSRFRFAVLTMLLVLTCAATPVTASQPRPRLVRPDNSLLFSENAGQFAPGARFQARMGNTTLWLADDALWLTVAGPESRARSPGADARSPAPRVRTPTVNLKLSFPGANLHPRLVPFARSITRVSYFTGHGATHWRPDVSVWHGVRYAGLYPGIDLEIGGRNGTWQPVLAVQPEAELATVRLRIEGAETLTRDPTGVRARTAAGDVRIPLLALRFAPEDERPSPGQAPTAELIGEVLTAPFMTAFAAPISPAGQVTATNHLVYGTFLGGSSDDEIQAVAVDRQGAAYVAGDTRAADFPITPGAVDPTFAGSSEAFVARFSADGTHLLYATFLGGQDIEQAGGVGLDSDGNAYVVGHTWSSDFPVTPGALMTTPPDGLNAFVTKLNSTGTALIYSTFLGGHGGECQDFRCGVTVDAAGSAYVTGWTNASDFPVTPGAYDTTANGGQDVFVAKLNPAGSALEYSTFLGGWTHDAANGIAVNAAREAYVQAMTMSVDFPTTPDAFDTSYNGGGNWGGDVAVVRLSADGGSLVYGTFLGSTGEECARSVCDLAIDAAGAAYVTGDTSGADFPTTPGAFDTSYNGGPADIFLTKLMPDGSALAYSTFLGTAGDEHGFGVAVTPVGAAWVSGNSYSLGFPTTPDAYDPVGHGDGDMVLGRLSANGSTLEYSTYLGGSGLDFNWALAADMAGAAYLAGTTSALDCPTTPGAFDTTPNGAWDAYLAKLAPGLRVRALLPIVLRNRSMP